MSDILIFFIVGCLLYELYRIINRNYVGQMTRIDLSNVEDKLEKIHLILDGSKLNRENKIAKFNLFKNVFIKELEEDGFGRKEALDKANDLLGDTREEEETNLKLEELISEFDQNKEKFHKAKTIENSINWWLSFKNKKLEKGFTVNNDQCYKCGENRFVERFKLDSGYHYKEMFCKNCGAQQGWWYKHEYLKKYSNKEKENTNKSKI